MQQYQAQQMFNPMGGGPLTLPPLPHPSMMSLGHPGANHPHAIPLLGGVSPSPMPPMSSSPSGHERVAPQVKMQSGNSKGSNLIVPVSQMATSTAPASTSQTQVHSPHSLGILAQISSNQPHQPISLPLPLLRDMYSGTKQEVRTKRYISVTLEGFDLGKKKMLLSWYEHGNGIPENCYLLVRHRFAVASLTSKDPDSHS
eukprot:TRINITY_DN4551_c0_g1_i2.p1 TRINITY_DN4551_c0_g1~~TRINITY_DN4551_c0_g1_i2.p1  ORF type:complete len:200 (-),score=28.40 TRINITY_DN4551_c0_g1_i2:560-1159(-)